MVYAQFLERRSVEGRVVEGCFASLDYTKAMVGGFCDTLGLFFLKFLVIMLYLTRYLKFATS